MGSPSLHISISLGSQSCEAGCSLAQRWKPLLQQAPSQQGCRAEPAPFLIRLIRKGQWPFLEQTLTPNAALAATMQSELKAGGDPPGVLLM